MKRRRFITKRTCLTLMMLLVGGAIVNVAVAWAVALLPIPNASPFAIDASSMNSVEGRMIITRLHQSVGRIVLTQEHKDWPGLRLDLDDYPNSLTPKWSRILPGQNAISDSDTPVRKYDEQATGWPLLAFRCWRLMSGDVFNERIENSRGAISIARQHVSGIRQEPLPYIPIWPGFAINTVFYAAVLWGLFGVPFALRKRRRIKRGWCPKCAYDLRGRAPTSTVCPECGMSVEPTP